MCQIKASYADGQLSRKKVYWKHTTLTENICLPGNLFGFTYKFSFKHIYMQASARFTLNLLKVYTNIPVQVPVVLKQILHYYQHIGIIGKTFLEHTGLAYKLAVFFKSVRKLTHKIAHFTVVCLLTWPWIRSEAGGDLVLIQTSLLFICK